MDGEPTVLRNSLKCLTLGVHTLFHLKFFSLFPSQGQLKREKTTATNKPMNVIFPF